MVQRSLLFESPDSSLMFGRWQSPFEVRMFAWVRRLSSSEHKHSSSALGQSV